MSATVAHIERVLPFLIPTASISRAVTDTCAFPLGAPFLFPLTRREARILREIEPVRGKIRPSDTQEQELVTFWTEQRIGSIGIAANDNSKIQSPGNARKP